MPFISSCLISMTSTSSTVSNRSGGSGHPFIVPVLRSNGFNPLSMMLAVGLSYEAFIMMRYDPSLPILLRVFIKKGYWILSNTFSASIDMTVIFVPQFVYVLHHVYCFVDIVPSLHSQINPAWSWCMIFLM
uniref:Uncharacterized protein n=1 Tax=Pipistrellus kuhlii TaxID=59472 RepID=A0A7J8A8L3_PIPKU|nr:hypothetical protein mPipKuh1_008868 [Pipistrellus kuhlii]